MTDERQKKIFSKNLSNYLHIYGKTQREVADAIHVSPQTFNTWCQGIALPRMGKVQLLADYFCINKSDLIEENTQNAPSSPDYTNTATPEEFEKLVKPYRDLDSSGKKHIDYELNREAARMSALNGKDARIKELEATVSESATPNYLVLNAAHERTDIEQSSEDKLSDYDMMSDENF